MKFWYTKFLMRFMAFLALMGFFGVLYYALDIETNYEPIGSRAPFSENIKINDALYTPGTGAMTLKEPHRSEREMSNWVTTATSEVLSIPNKQFDKTINDVDRYFTVTGKNDYIDYLSQSNVKQNVDSYGYSLNALVDGKPIILYAQEVKGVYRWVYQVPIIISFIPKNKSLGEAVTQNLTLVLQLRRAEINGDSEAIQIESWKINKRRS